MNILTLSRPGLLSTATEAAMLSASIHFDQMSLYDASAEALSERVETSQPDYLLILGVEQDPAHAQSNVEHCVHLAKTFNLPIIMTSSDRVFNRRQGKAWLVDEPVHPEDEKGKQLLHCESLVQSVEQHVLVRFGPLFGQGPRGRIEKLLYGEIESWDADVRRSFTASADAARVVLAMLQQISCGVKPPLWGSYHYGGVRAMSELAFARLVHDEAKLMLPSLELPDAPNLPDGGEQMRRDLNTDSTLKTFGIKPQPVRNWIVRELRTLLDEQIKAAEAES
ncbi:sugar nucleotide-binding protein [Salinibius halmophilus]|uniref:sugar nucleotide-binding protein n=1 Tax=Salinibius halmophilus TaxID=1853216 RepID=UPI00131500D7|nr:sugar nucleotide-binding protein [Salinibius halmophilus]